MKKRIFRKVALDRLSSPEQLDQLMQVTRPAGWLALLAVWGLLATAILWSVYGSVDTKVVGEGMLVRTGGVSSIVAMVPGQVTDLRFHVGDVIRRSEVVATLVRWDLDAGSDVRYVSSSRTGRVLELLVNDGQYVEEGTPLLSLESLDSRLEAVVYVRPADGKKVRPAMSVQLAPATVKPEEFGYLLGRVTSGSAFPATLQGMRRLLGSTELADRFSKGGPPHEIHVALVRDPAAADRYRWSSRDPGVAIYSGTLCTAKIIVERRRPLDLVIPLLKKTLGSY